mgnify:CR=1 FL=1
MFAPVSLQLLAGFWETLKVFILTLVFSIPLGLVICFGSMSKWAPFKALRGSRLSFLSGWRPVQWLCRTVVWIIRGTPLMLQLMIIFYGPGLLFGMSALPRPTATIVAFSLNYACYFSEIYRGGIESISRGQYEAGYVLGMTKSQIFKKIILKQVIQRIVPPMSNEIITLIKDTALANCIMVCEIIKNAKELAATKAMIWPLFYTGVFYLLFVGVLTIVLGKLEKKLSYFRS